MTLHEEQLIAHKNVAQVGDVVLRKQVEEVPSHVQAEVFREEVRVQHVPVNQVVQEQRAPWEEQGVTIVPVYEEQAVLVKQLVLREYLRVERVRTSETRQFQDTVRREKLVIDDPSGSRLVHEEHADPAKASANQPPPRA